nr:HAD-IIB family hydrolase [Bacillota bacterium]
MKFRLLALDLDGTLLTDDKKISPRAISALRAAADAGVTVVFCTGRRYRTVIPMVQQVGRPIPVAYNNGAAVRNCPQHDIVFKNLFPTQHFLPVIDLLESFGLKPVLHVDRFEDGIDLCCARSDTNHFHRAYVSRNAEFLVELDDLRESPADKIIQFIVMERLARLTPAYEALGKFATTDELNVHIVRNLTIGASALEVLSPLGEKWQAVWHIAKSRGIGRDEIVAIGDDISDCGLLRNAGLGIAVENALQEVKDSADLLVPRNNDDGAAIAIERFFL